MSKLFENIQDLLNSKGAEAIRRQVGAALPGEEKLEQAVDWMIEQADEHVCRFRQGTPGEVISDVILRTIVKPLVRNELQRHYDALKVAGELDPWGV